MSGGTAGGPDGLAGADIHPHARLMTVADSYDAMTSARPYRNALPIEEAARRLRANAGAQFATAAIEAFDAVEESSRPSATRPPRRRGSWPRRSQFLIRHGLARGNVA